MEKDYDLFEDEVEEITEAIEDYSQGMTYEDGSSFSGEEMEYWSQLVDEGNQLVASGQATEQEVIEAMNTNFKGYIERNDLKEFIDTESQHGFSKDDITNEAWEMYEANLGKKKLVDCIYDTSDFLQGLNDDKPVYSTRSKRHSDDFLEGFNS